jgi:hypothetical protein
MKIRRACIIKSIDHSCGLFFSKAERHGNDIGRTHDRYGLCTPTDVAIAGIQFTAHSGAEHALRLFSDYFPDRFLEQNSSISILFEVHSAYRRIVPA